jgi:glycosyltransferase involved in cell wall biosynthesis
MEEISMKRNVHVSVIIPAHNEEKYVKRCISSVRAAASQFRGSVEIIVVCNRCTDMTEQIARKNGARIIINNERCIAAVRNAGIKAARGKVVVTIDCDNRMTKGTICEIMHLLNSGKYIGGGAPIRFERYSFPLAINDIMCRTAFFITGLHCGIFWAYKETFDAIGGFVEKKAMEDAATAAALRKYGKSKGMEYTSLRNNYLINSTRKFDDMGDWFYFKIMLTEMKTFIKAVMGDTEDYDKLIDRIFYDYNDK